VSSNAAPVRVVHQFAIKLSDTGRYAACVSFLNGSSRMITAVRFEFNMIDAFHGSIAHFHGDRIGEFAPGVTIEGPLTIGDYNIGTSGGSYGGGNQKVQNCWTYYVDGTPETVTVEVTRVIYADGSEWAAPSTDTTGTAHPTPTTSPR
jgi:hypothetical protein